MVDIALIVFAVIVPLVLMAFNLIVLARYIDPQAATGHFIAKLTVLLGLLLAEGTILLLPLDVGNRAGVVGCGFWNNNCGGLDLVIVWEIVYCIIAGLVVVVFPFFIFFYENDDEGMQAEADAEGSFFKKLCDFRDCKRSFWVAFCYTLVTLVITLIVIGVSYRYLSTVHLPYVLEGVAVGAANAWAPQGSPIIAVNTYYNAQCPPGETCIAPCGNANAGTGVVGACTGYNTTMDMSATLLIYMAAIMTWAGWFIFSCYVPIGFVALPMDCFNSFRTRPKVLSVGEARVQRKALLKRSEELLRIGDSLASGLIEFNDEMHSKKERRKRNKIDAQEMNRFRVLVDMLEADLETFQLSDPQNYRAHYNPLVPYFKLVFGVVAAVLSLLWIIQIIVYMLFNPPLYSFLNIYFTWFDGWFPLLGTISVAIFGLYLLLAVAKGNFKFGTRFFLIKVHPMEPGKTLMNSFMFNCGLILLCTLPATQFCTQAFSQYARLTDADMLFGQFKYMTFFQYFYEYNVFMFMILGFFILAGIYFAIFPSDRDHLNKVMASIKAKKGAEFKSLERKVAQQGGSLSMAIEMTGGKKKSKK